MRRLILIGTMLSLLVLCFSPGSALAQDENLPVYTEDEALEDQLGIVQTGGRYRVPGDRGNRLARSGFGFLKLAGSARLSGMGDAYAGTSRDIHSIFQNPAGLTSVDRMAWVGSYNQWLVETWLGTAGIAYRTGIGVLGLTIRTMNYPTVEVTTPWQPEGTGQNLDLGDIAIGLVFAKRLTDKFSFGIKWRWAQQKLHVITIRGMMFDVGTMFYTGFKSVRIAMTMNNLGKNLEAFTEDYRLPFNYDMALAAELYGEVGDPVYLTGAFEHLFFKDFGERDHLGGELWLGNLLALRAGYKWGYDVSVTRIQGILDEYPIRMTLSGTF